MSRESKEDFDARRTEERHREQMIATIVASLAAKVGFGYVADPSNQKGIVKVASELVSLIGWDA